MKKLLMFLIEPFKKSTKNTPLVWRMKMRWSHFPLWVKRIPCVIGHRWDDWEAIKYITTGERQRNCKICGKLDVSDVIK